MTLSTVRHDEIFNARLHETTPVTVVGCGAIGSRIVAALIELGISKNLTLIDYDRVESHNLANQIFNASDVGTLKIEACNKWAMQKTGTHTNDISLKACKLPQDDVNLQGVVFLAVDSMAARREIADTMLKRNLDVTFVVETRMAATHGNILSFNPNNEIEYRGWIDTLIDDDHQELSACGSTLSVGTTASMMANLAVWQYIHHHTNPAAVDQIIDVFLQPLVVNTRRYANVQEAA